MTLVERARRLIAGCPPAISGQGGHGATFRVACALVWGFGFTPEEAMPLMMEYNDGCQPRWSPADLWHKLRSALSTNHTQPRGHLVEGDADKGTLPEYVVPKKREAVKFDLEALKRAQRTDWKVDAAFLRARSPIDPQAVTSGQVIDLLYSPEDFVMVFGSMESRGDWMRWRGRWFALGKTPDVKSQVIKQIPERTKEGAVWMIQPVDGQWHPVIGKTTLSRRTLKSVRAYPYLLLESDEAPADLWLNMLARLSIPVVAIVTSGGRSCHALVRVGCATLTDWKECVSSVKDTLAAFGCDPQALSNPAVNMRLPNILREGKMKGRGDEKQFTPYANGPMKQRLIFFNPKADGRAIGEGLIYHHA